MKKLLIAALATIAIAGCGSGTLTATTPGTAPQEPTTNFNNADVLATDVGNVADAKQTDGSTVDVTCIHVGGTQFTCIGVWSDGSPNSTTTVTVSKDGQTWISS